MLRIAGRQIFRKIMISTLAGSLLIFPALVGSKPVAAQVETTITSEQIEETFGENADEVQENLLLSTFYMAKYAETQEIRHLDRAIESVQQVVGLQPDFVPAQMMLYIFLSEKAIVQADETVLAQIDQYYQAFMSSSLESEDLKQIPPPAYIAGQMYYRISFEQIGEEDSLRYQQKAIDAFQQAISINPDFYLAHHQLGRIHYFQDKNDLALLEVQEAIRLNANDPNNYDLLGDIYTDNIHRSETGWDNEAIKEGIRAYKEAIRLAPGHVSAHRGLSNLYIHQGSYNLAVMEAKIAVELSDTAFSHKKLAEALLRVENYEQAIQEYREALRRDNSFMGLHANIAFAHFLQGRFEDAVQEYQKHMDLDDPSNLSVYPVIHHHLALRQIGKHGEAQKLLEDYMPDFEGEEWELALLQFHLGQLSETELLNQADSNKGKQAEAFFYSGYQYLLIGETAKAQGYFQDVLDTDMYCYYEYLAARVELSQLALR